MLLMESVEILHGLVTEGDAVVLLELLQDLATLLVHLLFVLWVVLLDHLEGLLDWGLMPGQEVSVGLGDATCVGCGTGY